MKGKKAQTGMDKLLRNLIWIVFLIVILGAAYYLLKTLGVFG